MERAEIIREKGTNRARFFRNEVDKYTWIDRGSYYGLSDILAAYLFGQLQEANKIQKLARINGNFTRTGSMNGRRIMVPPCPMCRQTANNLITYFIF